MSFTRRLTPELWDAFLNHDRRACARLMSLVENDSQSIPAIRRKIGPLLQGSMRIGITGPPGVGKSTVTSALTHMARIKGHRVGVVAVDPSSPFTGGAFLGDRIRMQHLTGDNDVFIRSLASRDGHGGLAPATPYVAEILDAFGMDWIIIETVGVGQAELDVLHHSDLVVLVLQPGMGDVIQALKAGIIEIADLFVVNKADREGADAVAQSIEFTLELGGMHDPETRPPILQTSAENQMGIDRLYDAVQRTYDRLHRTGILWKKRETRLRTAIVSAIQSALWSQCDDAIGINARLDEAIPDLIGDIDAQYGFIEQVCSDAAAHRMK